MSEKITTGEVAATVDKLQGSLDLLTLATDDLKGLAGRYPLAERVEQTVGQVAKSMEGALDQALGEWGSSMDSGFSCTKGALDGIRDASDKISPVVDDMIKRLKNDLSLRIDMAVEAMEHGSSFDEIIRINRTISALDRAYDAMNEIADTIPTSGSEILGRIQECVVSPDKEVQEFEADSPAIDKPMKDKLDEMAREVGDEIDSHSDDLISYATANNLIDFDLVRDIAHNETNRDETLSNYDKGVQAVANENIDLYLGDEDMRRDIVVPIAKALEADIDKSLMESPDFSIEMVLGACVAKAAQEHAYADLDYFADEFKQRAATCIDEMNFGEVAERAVKESDEFSRAGIDADKQIPTGFVTVRKVADELRDEDNPDIWAAELTAKEIADATYRAATVVQGETHLETELSLTNAVIDEAKGKRPEAGDRESLDDMMSAKSAEADLDGNGGRGDLSIEMQDESR